MPRSTHTYAVLELSEAAVKEIEAKLRAAGYEDQFHREDGRIVIDMHGIAVAPEKKSAALSTSAKGLS